MSITLDCKDIGIRKSELVTKTQFLYSLQGQLETLGAFKIVIFRSTSLKLNLLKQNLYVDFKNGLNPENPITNDSRPLFYKNKIYF